MGLKEISAPDFADLLVHSANSWHTPDRASAIRVGGRGVLGGDAMAYVVTTQDPATGRRERIVVAADTTAGAIVAAGAAAPGMRVLDVRRAEDAPEGAEIELLDDDAAAFAPAGIAAAAEAESHIEWRPARRPILPLVAAWVFGVAVGGAGALTLTGQFDRLLEIGSPTVGKAAPSDAPAIDAVHGAPEMVAATDAGAAGDAPALPADTQRIGAVNADESGSIYRVITRDDATGYLYETLIRAATAEEAATRCAAKSRLRVLEVQWVADPTG